MQWREWSGYFASRVYADAHDIEYNAIREAAALIDVSPLYKYRVVRARRDPPRRPGHHPRRDEAGGRAGLLHAVVRRARQGHRRRHRPSPRRRLLPLDRGRPAAPLAAPERAGLDVTIDGRVRGDRRARAPGPAVSRDVLEAATGESFADLRYFRRRARHGSAGSRSTCRGPATPATSGYELWIPAEAAVDGLGRADGGRRRLRHPAGRDARPRRRPARGRADPARGRLHVRPPRDEPGAELLARSRSGSAGWSTSTRRDFVGRRALERERAAGGPARRLVGLQLDWYDIEGLYDAQGLPPAISADRRSLAGPGLRRRAARSARRTSHGWSPILKQAIALASVPPRHEAVGTQLDGRVDGRGPPRPGRRDRRGAAVPRPAAQARLTTHRPRDARRPAAPGPSAQRPLREGLESGQRLGQVLTPEADPEMVARVPEA